MTKFPRSQSQYVEDLRYESQSVGSRIITLVQKKGKVDDQKILWVPVTFRNIIWIVVRLVKVSSLYASHFSLPVKWELNDHKQMCGCVYPYLHLLLKGHDFLLESFQRFAELWATPPDQEAGWSGDCISQNTRASFWNLQMSKELMVIPSPPPPKRNLWSNCVIKGGVSGLPECWRVRNWAFSLKDSFWHFFSLNLENLKQNHIALKSVFPKTSPVSHDLKWELGSRASWFL